MGEICEQSGDADFPEIEIDLWILEKQGSSVRETKSAFLVEGQMDFLMSYQSGVKNVIASSGTALTTDHLRVVHRLGGGARREF